MITQVKDFISGIVSNVRTTTFVTGKVSSSAWESGAPFYFHGTPLEINVLLGQVPSSKNKYPAIFLFEPILMNENNDITQVVGASPKLQIYFMHDWASQEQWTTGDHYTNIIDDMDELKREFIKKLKANKYVKKITDYSTVRHAKWGLFFNDQGYKNQVFNDQLSGVELEITLDIKRIIDGCDLFE